MVGSNISQRVYVDSNVFLSLIFEESRVDLVEASWSMFNDVISCRFFLVVSAVTVREIVKVTGLSRSDVFEQVFRPYLVLDKFELVKLSMGVAEEATAFSGMFGIHMLDAMHAAFASLNGCWLVTFDRELKDAAGRAGVKVFDPRDLGL